MVKHFFIPSNKNIHRFIIANWITGWYTSNTSEVKTLTKTPFDKAKQSE